MRPTYRINEESEEEELSAEINRHRKLLKISGGEK
jgi:hypothetical protein